MPTKTGTFSLALGGGGARGLAHVGVLRVFEQAGLAPAGVAGTSMGAVVGALYAAGVAPHDLTERVDLLDLKGLAGVAKINLRPGSVLSADAFEERMRTILPATFAELAMPFAAVAADLVTGERVVITEGDLPRAVRASMSIPVLFEPVRMGEALLVDGGVVEPVPVEAARSIAGGPVVAVDVGPLRPPGHPATSRRGSRPPFDPAAPTVAQVGTRSFDIAEHWLARRELESAAAVIAPDVGSYLIMDFLDGATIVAEGERAAWAALSEVRAAIEDAARPPLARWWRGLASRLGRAVRPHGR